MNNQAKQNADIVRRFTTLKAKAGLALLVVAVIFAALVWIKQNFLSIRPGDGAPLGFAFRSETHIAQLMQTLEPYTPSPNRDHSKDTYALSILLVPLDGSATKVVPIKGKMSPNSYQLAKIIGTDGDLLWFDAAGDGAVNLTNHKLLKQSERGAPPARQGMSALGLNPRVEQQLAAGFFATATTWIGLHSPEEAARDLRPGFSLKRVRDAEVAKQQRRLHRAAVNSEGVAGRYSIESSEEIDAAEYLNAAFIRMDEASEPIRLSDPDGALMIHTSDPGLTATLIAARVDLNGKIVWTVDTGIDRFLLKQILPGASSTAFIGTRPAEPGKVAEPLLVIVEHEDGGVRTVSLKAET